MKPFRFFLLAVSLVCVCVTSHAYMPFPGMIVINGDTIDYVVGMSPSRFSIPKANNAKYLTGIAAATAEEIATAEVQCTRWVELDAFVVALMEVDYMGSRSTENYIATYRRSAGIIDGALVQVSYDTKIVQAPYMFPTTTKYYLKPRIDDDDIVLKEDSVVVTRRYSSNCYPDSTLAHVEDGTIVACYTISSGGRIYRQPTMNITAKRCDFTFASDGSRTKGPVTTHNDLALSGVGLDLINLYSMPANYQDLPAMAAQVEKCIEDDMQRWGDDKTLQSLRDNVLQWQKNLIYRNPTLWLDALYKSREVPAMLKENIQGDPEFSQWFKAQAAKVNPQSARQWWTKQLASRPTAHP